MTISNKPPQVDITSIVGMVLDEAIYFLSDFNMTLRIIEKDGEDLINTAEFVHNRINVATKDDKIVSIKNIG